MSVRQEVFDRVSRHLLTQGERSTSMGRCRYRGAGGLRCALGVLIRDDLYRTSMENFGPSDKSVREAIAESLGIREVDDSLLLTLIRLQEIHDYGSPSRWKDLLIVLALQEGLQASSVDEVIAQ